MRFTTKFSSSHPRWYGVQHHGAVRVMEALEYRHLLSANPTLVRDVNPDTEASDPGIPVNFNGTTFFVANDSVHGRELWKTDGTAAGTKLVKDINPGKDGSDPADLVAMNRTLYFSADNGIHGRTIWKTDGTSAGTKLVRAIPPTGAGSSPGQFTVVGSTLFFIASVDNDSYYDRGLWKSDGTSAGTKMLARFHGDEDFSTAPGGLTAVGGTLFFNADDLDGHGSELWKSNGTAAGTRMVKDIFIPMPAPPGNDDFFKPMDSDPPADVGSHPSDLTVVGNTVYFFANDQVHGRELWKSDGTAVGTRMIKDINPAGDDSDYYGNYLDTWDPRGLTRVGSTLYFSADDGKHGQELWKSDGTSAGTKLVKDIYPGDNEYSGPFSSSPSGFAKIGSTLYFSASDALHGNWLWKSDGTSAGTKLVKNAATSDEWRTVTNLTVAGNTLYFLNGGDELWKSNGTGSGTFRIKSMVFYRPEDYEYQPVPTLLTGIGSTLYFTADDSVHGRELWKSDGTSAGTKLIRDINLSGVGSAFNLFAATSNRLFFTIGSEDGPNDLWTSDGTTSGTRKLADFSEVGYYDESIGGVAAVDSILYFAAEGGLWRSDGTVNGTRRLREFGSFGPTNLTPVGKTLYFTAFDSTHGRELWKCDGTTSGTKLVKDIYPGGNGAFPDLLWHFEFAAVGNSLYFVANDGTHGSELWKSDGTSSGTKLVRNISPSKSENATHLLGLTGAGNRLFFSAYDDKYGYELWTSDGTSSGTKLVKDIYPGVGGSQIYSLTAVGNTLYFMADDRAHGQELWKSDGTLFGTKLVKDLHPGPQRSFVSEMKAAGKTLFFSADDGVHGYELWKSDGTAAGTKTVREIAPESAAASPRELAVVGGTLFFTADDLVHGRELWKTDGSATGTVLVRDFIPGVTGSDPTHLTTTGGPLYFVADDGIHGRELWKV